MPKYNDLLDNYSLIITFNQLQSKPLVCTASPLPLLLELSCKEACWHFRQPQGATVTEWVASPAPVSGHGQVRGNTASILACVQVRSDFSHPQCINQCSCPSLASLQWIAIAFRINVCGFSELYCLQYVMFFMLSVKRLCSIVLLPFSAILTNLILFIFHVPNTTAWLFTVKPFCNLSLPLSVQTQDNTNWRAGAVLCRY